MSDILQLSIFTPERKLVSSLPVDWVKLPTYEGEIDILVGHEHFVGLLETGVLTYQVPGEVQHQAVVSTGTFEVQGNHVKVLAETLELPGEIDSDRAKQAQKKAEEMLSQAALDPDHFGKYQLKLQRALVRQQATQRPGQ